MVDKITVELDEQFLKKFFGITERIIPEGQEITPAMLRKQLDEIEDALVNAKLAEQESKLAAAKANKPNYQAAPVKDSFGEISAAAATFGEDQFNLPKKTILIIDDLGVITYQLGVLFKKFNYETVDSKEIYDAIEKFKKQDFDLVVMDLFIPTEREGFILLEELKKTSSNKRKPSKIGVMSASAKKEHKQLCKMKGAEFYIEKIDDWQKELINLVKGLS